MKFAFKTLAVAAMVGLALTSVAQAQNARQAKREQASAASNAPLAGQTVKIA